jgi:hypothetical protein
MPKMAMLKSFNTINSFVDMITFTKNNVIYICDAISPLDANGCPNASMPMAVKWVT